MSPDEHQPAKRRPRLQFSLWTLLIVTTVAAVLAKTATAEPSFGPFGPGDPFKSFFSIVLVVIVVAGPMFIFAVSCMHEQFEFTRVFRLFLLLVGLYLLSAVVVLGFRFYDLWELIQTTAFASLWWAVQCSVIFVGFVGFFITNKRDAGERRQRQILYPKHVPVELSGDDDSQHT